MLFFTILVSPERQKPSDADAYCGKVLIIAFVQDSFFFQKLFLEVHRRLIRLLGAGAAAAGAGDTETLQKKLKQGRIFGG